MNEKTETLPGSGCVFQVTILSLLKRGDFWYDNRQIDGKLLQVFCLYKQQYTRGFLMWGSGGGG